MFNNQFFCMLYSAHKTCFQLTQKQICNQLVTHKLMLELVAQGQQNIMKEITNPDKIFETRGKERQKSSHLCLV